LSRTGKLILNNTQHHPVEHTPDEPHCDVNRMQLKQLSLMNFRNYHEVTIKFSDGIHVLFGENGAGKTSILEAIHYLALTKSFRTGNDRNLILTSEKMFRVQGVFQNSQGQTLKVAIAYSIDSGKRLTVNQQSPQTFSEYIGEVPVVLLHPADLRLSQGSPQHRRRFLDVLLSQSSKVYLHHLIQYNRSLKQRNQLLQDPLTEVQLLRSWEENLVNYGVELIVRRREAAARLGEMVTRYYRQISKSNDLVTIDYRTNVPGTTEAEIARGYRETFDEKRHREQAYGTTLVGPHRDDLMFLLNGTPMREYASQGEHKTLVIALKLAEFHFLQEQRASSPMLLFDDIFGELDGNRIRLMLHQLSNIGQVFVTTTSRTFFDKVQEFEAPIRFYRVENGTVHLTDT